MNAVQADSQVTAWSDAHHVLPTITGARRLENHAGNATIVSGGSRTRKSPSVMPWRCVINRNRSGTGTGTRGKLEIPESSDRVFSASVGPRFRSISGIGHRLVCYLGRTQKWPFRHIFTDSGSFPPIRTAIAEFGTSSWPWWARGHQHLVIGKRRQHRHHRAHRDRDHKATTTTTTTATATTTTGIADRACRLGPSTLQTTPDQVSPPDDFSTPTTHADCIAVLGHSPSLSTRTQRGRSEDYVRIASSPRDRAGDVSGNTSCKECLWGGVGRNRDGREHHHQPEKEKTRSPTTTARYPSRPTRR